MSRDEILLSVRRLSVSFFTDDCVVQAVQNVSFSIKKGRTFTLVGESGCGKTSVALSIMRLLPAGQGKIVSGQVFFEGQDLLSLSEKQMRQVRGDKIALIFQEPMTSLNPVYKVGDQIAEVIRLHHKKKASQARTEAVEMLLKVGIADAGRIACAYPHQLSGGMQQRVMIAMAACCRPALLIADEPTTALDVTTSTQILDLLDRLQKETCPECSRRDGMSMLLITHDLGVAAEHCDDVAVMYASRIVEKAASQQIFGKPYHPYTQGLLKCMPHLGVSDGRLPTIPGAVPEPSHFPSGCKFHPRCPIGCADKRCQTVEPSLQETETGRWVACWYAPSLIRNENKKIDE